jgi:protein translocase SecG subunit
MTVTGILLYVAYGIYAVAAVLMVGAILLQEGRGGGLSALGGTQAESAFGASNPVRRLTVVLAIIFFVLAGLLSFVSSGSGVEFGEEEGGAAPSTEVEAGAETDREGAEDAGPAEEPGAEAVPSEDASTEPPPEGAGAIGEAGPPAPVEAGDASEADTETRQEE